MCLPEQEATRLRGVVETESAARGQQQQEAVAAQATRDHYRTTSKVRNWRSDHAQTSGLNAPTTGR